MFEGLESLGKLLLQLLASHMSALKLDKAGLGGCSFDLGAVADVEEEASCILELAHRAVFEELIEGLDGSTRSMIGTQRARLKVTQPRVGGVGRLERDLSKTHF